MSEEQNNQMQLNAANALEVVLNENKRLLKNYAYQVDVTTQQQEIINQQAQIIHELQEMVDEEKPDESKKPKPVK